MSGLTSSAVSDDRVSLDDPVTTTPKHEAVKSNTSYNSINSVSRGSGVGNSVQSARWKPSVFDFKSGRPGSICPTCKGVGRIPKGHEDELVALIPYNDKRLKPRRTCVYVLLVAVLLIVTGGVLTAFLYPRSIVIQVLSITPTKLPNTTSSYVQYTDSNSNNMSILLGVETTLGVMNSNFYPVTVSVINVTVMYSLSEVGFESYPAFDVRSRSSKNVSVILNTTFVQPQSGKVRFVCTGGGDWDAIIYLTASALAQYSYLGQVSSSVGDLGDHVDCSNASIVITAPTLIPP